MKRTTIQPTSGRIDRKSVSIPPGVSRMSITGGRQSFAVVDENRLKEKRNVRDREHQELCRDKVQRFLLENGYEKHVDLSRDAKNPFRTPTMRQFQEVFRFIYSYVEPNMDPTKRFEEEVIFFIRGFKYPYSSEINKSQLISITHHTWPVLLSMLAWMIDLVKVTDGIDEYHPNMGESNRLFCEYLYRGYSNYMENGSEDEIIGKELESALEDMNKERHQIIEENRARLAEIQEGISKLSVSHEELGKLEERKDQIYSNIGIIAQGKEFQKNKIKEYKKEIEKLREQDSSVMEQISLANKKKESLEKEIDLQNMKPEEIELMNSEREETTEKLNQLKEEKAKYLKKLRETEIDLKNRTEELEKLLFDINNIKGDFSLEIGFKKKSERNSAYKNVQTIFFGSPKEEYQRISEICSKITQEIKSAEENLQEITEQKNTLLELCSTLKEEVRAREKKIRSLAEIYVEKKQCTESEEKAGNEKMEKMEDELLKLTVESNSSLLQSEQNMERARIRYNRITGKISYGKSELEEIGALLDASLTNCISLTSELIQSCIKNMGGSFSH